MLPRCSDRRACPLRRRSRPGNPARDSGGAGLERHRLEPTQIRRDRPARLGLPPVVDHRAAEHLRRPVVGVGVEALTGGEERLQRVDGVLLQFLGVRIRLAHSANRRGSGEQCLDAVLGDDPPERTRIGGADGLALVHHRRCSDQQRAVDDVGVADHPAHIGRGPPHVARIDVVDVAHRPRQGHGVPTVVADHALGLPGGAGGVEDVERVVAATVTGSAGDASAHSSSQSNHAAEDVW